MREHGREPIVFAPTEAQPMHAGREALLALCSARRTADAIIVANDNLAFGALLSVPGAGIRVPEQCAIVGFGDYPMAEMLTPGLTTVRPPASEIGITAAARIFQLLQEDPPTLDTLRKSQRPMSCQLIIRASS
ncbi:substrate-binding domain-containing protein [Burkholderia contaminans]|uniref:substrate-binding domain-containing protein n=1 Tax=Burkholderia contaminans TaxID=488447 RepID=UPI001ABB5135|nr:substrate-binding domain-containing protein [Burkholderia contaminans]